MISPIKVLCVHWVVRGDDGSCCRLLVSYHLREDDYVLFARARRNRGWQQEGCVSEQDAPQHLVHELTSEQARREHGVAHHDFARAV